MPAASGNGKQPTGNQRKNKPTVPKNTNGSPPRDSTAETGARPVAARAEEAERIRLLQRIEEIEKQQKELEAEKRELIPKTAAMMPPVAPMQAFAGKRRGFSYHTWFKAIGSMDDLLDLKGTDSPTIVHEMMEFDDFDIPMAFYSHSILGKVKWNGIRTRDDIIGELNFKGDWSPNDFRDVYSSWEYTYRIVESVGDVPVRVYEYRAKQPRSMKDKGRGWKNE